MIKARTKSVLILIITLLLGAAIGFEISEIMIKKKFDQINAFRKQHGFVQMFENIIKPDSKQKPLIDSILLKYHKKMQAVERSGMEQVGLKIDSMQTELKKVLTEEQKSRLETEMQRMKAHKPPEGERGPMPPPPKGNGFPPQNGHEPMPQPNGEDRMPPPHFEH
jgi:hypothetical protein